MLSEKDLIFQAAVQIYSNWDNNPSTRSLVATPERAVRIAKEIYEKVFENETN